jgi:ATP-dependent protease HslVU (ClpYQ) peptidase subunit
MTTIAAVQGNGWAVIGADSRSSEDNRVYTLGDSFGKIATNGAYLLAAAGELKAINLLNYTLTPPTPPTGITGSALDRFFATKFIPALRDCFTEAGAGKLEGNESYVIAVVHGVVYEIGSSYEWLRDERGIYAIGSGGDFATGVLQYLSNDMPIATRSQKDAEIWVRNALKVAAELDAYTSGPFVIERQSFKGKVTRG